MRMVKCSAKLLGSWFTKGFKQDAIAVLEGVPEGSTLVAVNMSGSGDKTVVEMLFAHPDDPLGKVVELVTPRLRSYKQKNMPELVALRELRNALVEALKKVIDA